MLKEIKLSEVKVGQVLWDMPYENEYSTCFKVAKIEDGRVFMNWLLGDKGYKFSDGFTVFSLFCGETFYKPTLNQ